MNTTVNTEPKRHFYNTGDARGFTRKTYFETILNILEGGDIDAATRQLVLDATNYELESISLKSAATAVPDDKKKDRLHSDYANALRAGILPLVDATPRTGKELIQAATTKGIVSPTGKAFVEAWVVSVLKNEPGIVTVQKVIEKTQKNGLKAQAEVTAFKRA